MKVTPLPSFVVAALLGAGSLPARAEEPSVDEAAWDAACAVEGSRYALRVDDRVFPTCELVFGDPSLREGRESVRRSRVLRVRSSGRRVDVLYQDPALREPRVRQLEGIDILAVLEGEVEELPCDPDEELPDGGAPDDVADAGARDDDMSSYEPVALVRLDSAFAGACPGDLYAVRADDALGAEGQVLAVEPSGLLVLYRGDLLWAPRDDEARAPRFRMIWRSDFVLIVEDKSPRAKPKRRPKRRRRRGRR